MGPRRWRMRMMRQQRPVDVEPGPTCWSGVGSTGSRTSTG